MYVLSQKFMIISLNYNFRKIWSYQFYIEQFINLLLSLLLKKLIISLKNISLIKY